MTLTELTPEHMRGAIAASCHAIFETEEGDILIIGKRAGDIAAAEGIKVADDESAIVVDPAILANLSVW